MTPQETGQQASWLASFGLETAWRDGDNPPATSKWPRTPHKTQPFPRWSGASHPWAIPKGAPRLLPGPDLLRLPFGRLGSANKGRLRAAPGSPGCPCLPGQLRPPPAPHIWREQPPPGLGRTHRAWVKALSPSGTAGSPRPEQSTPPSPSQLQGAGQGAGEAPPLGPAELPKPPQARKPSTARHRIAIVVVPRPRPARVPRGRRQRVRSLRSALLSAPRPSPPPAAPWTSGGSSPAGLRSGAQGRRPGLGLCHRRCCPA